MLVLDANDFWGGFCATSIVISNGIISFFQCFVCLSFFQNLL